MVEDRLLDFCGHTVGVRPARAGQAVDDGLAAAGLEVAANFVELLARVAHQHVGLRNVVEIVRKFEQRQLAACYLLMCGHVRFLRELDEIFWRHGPNCQVIKILDRIFLIALSAGHANQS